MDRYLLEYEIKRNGLTVSEFCHKVGISTASYYRKINGRSDFTQSEISKTMEVLDLTSPIPIFFTK